MSNKEFYKKTFSQVRPSRTVRWEDFEMKNSTKRPLRGLVTAAAVIALLAALSVTAVAVNFLGLRDILLPRQSEVNVIDPDTGMVVPGRTTQVDIISLSGFMDAPESRALAEWQDFLDGYDQDGSILASVGNTLDPELFEKYGCYYVYTQEMGDKLEEIAAKYSLRLHTGRIDLYAHPEVLGDLADFGKENETCWTYMYEDGGCHFDGYAYVEGWGLVDVQFQRSVKGTFNEVYLNIVDVDQYQEWIYQTACGTEVLLAMGSGKSLVVADLPDCFVVFNVFIGADGEMTKERLEAVADCYDFTLLTPVVKPVVEDKTAQEKALDSPQQAYANALWELWGSGIFPDGSQADPEELQALGNEFAVYDVDGDGAEELIILYTSTYMAGMKGYVVEFDPDYTGPGAPLRVQFMDFPALHFYDNYTLKVDWSHNQTMGELWPYHLYRYNAENDTYGPVAWVESWDKDIGETDHSGNPFPDEVDKDGNGVVYRVTLIGEDSGEELLDDAEYQLWWENTMDGAGDLVIPYQPLTQENIQALSDSPLPVLPFTMPAG